MEATDVQVGERLVAARKSGRLSQRDLARYSGVSQPTIHRIESGERDASVLELSAFADACGVLVTDLQGTNTLADEVRCAGRTDDAGTGALAEYLIYAFGLSRRLDELGVVQPA